MLIKSLLIVAYRQLRYLYCRYVKSRYYRSHKLFADTKLQKISNRKEYYFGYYNLSPENRDGDILYSDLAHSKDGYIENILKRDGKEYIIGQSKAFNLQQGCMLQWGSTNNKLAYYNTYNCERNHYECVIYDTQKMAEVKRLNMPVYSISKQEDYALSLNFELLSEMRPDYGYFARKEYDIPKYDKDGIWRIDLQTNEIELIITLKQLADLCPVETMIGARHKVNHIDISPDGSRFMFLHRWVGPMGRYMRLITADKNGNNLIILNGDKMTSHCGWSPDSKRIVSYCYTEEFGEAYVEFFDGSSNKIMVSKKMLSVDGHPTYSPNGEWIVTDCYPKFNRFSELYLYNIRKDECICIGRFYQPLKYFRTSRIDLHPKWNMDGTRVYFESGHEGTRKLFFVDVKEMNK